VERRGPPENVDDGCGRGPGQTGWLSGVDSLGRPVGAGPVHLDATGRCRGLESIDDRRYDPTQVGSLILGPPLEMSALAGRKAPGYIVSPALNGDDAVLFVPGLGGRTRFVADWNAPGWEPVIRRATWNQPMNLPPLDERGSSLASLLARSGSPRVVLVGHSMGGLVCLEAARRIGSQLRGIVVMCQNPPHRTPLSKLVDLPDLELAEQIGGVPSHVLDNAAALSEYARLWRSEYRLLNRYLESDPRPVLNAPMVAVGATDDPSSNNAQFLEDWQEYTTGRLAVHMIDGGHQMVEQLSAESVHEWVREVCR
jgi:surfactin synthase thioesterase subunit